MKKWALGICGIIAAVVLGLYFLLTSGSTSFTPHPVPPKEAKNIYFYEHTAWQTWDYEYRFDAPPDVCEKFAVNLMKSQSLHGGSAKISRSDFKEFPLTSRFKPWFDVSSVKHGLLISGDDWIYAVVDLDKGRLYYYNSQ